MQDMQLLAPHHPTSADGPEKEPLLEMSPAVPTQAKGLTVLVAEDDEADAFLILDALEKCPAVGNVVTAQDGWQAMAHLAMGVQPDVAIFDLNMPHMGGLALMRELSSSAQTPFPIIVMTSSRASEDAYRSYKRGAWLAVSKPHRAEDYTTFLNAAFMALAVQKPGHRRRHANPRWQFVDPYKWVQ